ncbi:MAG: hypothetical protein ABR954_09050 [Dehalococcoidales bacterium]
MKISQSKVRVESHKAIPLMNSSIKSRTTPKTGVQKQAVASATATLKTPTPMKKAPKLGTPATKPTTENFSSYGDNAVALQRILASARQELELIRRMKTETLKYQQKTATKARSEAHQLLLSARLTTHREIEEVIRQASEEIQKVLADIRVIRITAQEELATQRRYTDAAKLNSLSLSFKETFEKATEQLSEKKPEIVKP